MKKEYFLILFLLIAQTIQAQSVEEIQQSPDYLWGTGNAATLKQADNSALAAPISQISTKVSASFEQLTEGKQAGTDVTANETFKSVINTYSRATLNNTRRIVIQNEPDAAVMRYIKVSEIQRIFEGRKNKILTLTQEAMQAEKKAQVADALRYYYWANLLLQSYPDGNYLTMEDEEGSEQLLVTWLPKQMNDIFSHIQLNIADVRTDNELKTVNIEVLYKGKPARNYDYTYFDGRDWSNIFSAKDGRGIIELPAIASAKGLSIKSEYMFEGEANIDNELSEVMESVNPIAMRNAYLKLNGEEKQEADCSALAQENAAQSTNNNMYFITSPDSISLYQGTLQKIESAIRAHRYNEVQPLCTATGYDMFNRLIKFGNAKIIDRPNYQFLRCGEEIICRSLPMSFSFKGNHRTFVEDVVFKLSDTGKLDGISFGLNKPAVDDIINQTSWGDNVRKVLINFLEDYKTAYALKRYDYINSVFSDDALIITGSVLKSSGANERQPMDRNMITYTKQTKQEYMRKLKHIFGSNEFVNIHFADNQVRKSGVGGEIYGIQIKQEYFSSNYGDTGYLFLMVDLNNPKEPIIHVRTWQPEKDPNFGLIDLSSF